MDNKTEEKSTDLKDNYLEFASLAMKLAIMYGLPAAIKIVKTMTNDKVTAERIAQLTVTKKPKEYFQCLSGCFEDRDCDGVKDSLDKCPDAGAPEGGCVTADGCPDSDCNGIADSDEK